MTLLAKQVKHYAAMGMDSEQILAMGYGTSIHEIDFIIEQLKATNNL